MPREKETSQQRFCPLDGIGLSISMQLSAASSVKRNALPNSTLMKYFIATFALLALAMPMVAQEKSFPLKDLKDKASYSIGVDIALNFKKQNMDLNPDALAAGAKDGLNGKPQISPNEVREIMTQWQKELGEKQKTMATKNQADGEKYLADNKKKDGVKTTGSGLQYKSLKEGAGPQPKGTDTVTVNYRGTLIDGTEFDSSYKRGEPATFPLNGVIKGWTEGLQLMKKGSKYQFVIPSGLAYGDRAVGSDIGPNSTLIFEVELLDVKPPAEGPPSSSPSPSASAK
jgi:FKBP-type peptidyl-prolyl cis-trans isomerase FklB